MDYRLTPDELTILWNAHRATKDRRLADRIKVVYDLGRGWKPEDIADCLMMDEKTIRLYYQKYKENGIDGLLTVKYRGREPKLTQAQTAKLENYLDENLIQTTKEVIDYVYKTFKVKYSHSGMVKLLHALGFSYKKPKLIPGNADCQAQQQFIETYQQLRKTTGKNVPILFMDGCHPTFNSIAGYGWIRKGKEKELKSNTGRQRLNINGAIDVKTLQWSVDLPESVNAQSTISLFRKIEQKYPSAPKIYIIADNARYYRSKMVRGYLSRSKIEVIFLPAYSPNLNLIERFWKYFKKKVLNNQYYSTFEQFVHACKCFFLQRKRHNDELRTLLTENFQLFST